MKAARFRHALSTGEIAGMVAIAAAGALSMIDIRLSSIPLTLFVLACTIAPFRPTSNFFMPVIARGNAASGGVAFGPYRVLEHRKPIELADDLLRVEGTRLGSCDAAEVAGVDLLEHILG